MHGALAVDEKEVEIHALDSRDEALLAFCRRDRGHDIKTDPLGFAEAVRHDEFTSHVLGGPGVVEQKRFHGA